MSVLIDNTKIIKPVNYLKFINIFFIFLILAMIGFTQWKLWSDFKSLDSSLIPVYTVYFMNSVNINFSVILCASLVPAIFLTYKKKYLMSILVILLFFFVAFIFREKVEFYRLFV